MVCPCKPQKIACLRHWKDLCSCDNKRKVLLYRYKIADIDNLLLRLGPGSEDDDLSHEYNNNNNTEETNDGSENVFFTPYKIASPGRSRDASHKLNRSPPSPTKQGQMPSPRKLARSAGTLNIVDEEIDLDEATTFTMEKMEAYRTLNVCGDDNLIGKLVGRW